MLSHHYQQQTLHCIQPPLQSKHFPAMHPPSPPELATGTFTSSSTSPSSLSALPLPPSSSASATAPASPANTAMDFPKFMHLPAEIRTMVWEYALPEPRVYEIMDVPGAKQKMKPVDGLMFANVHHEPPPALAAVCIESRVFTLKHYQPLQLGNTTKYVDLTRDLLLLEPYLLLKRLHRTLQFMSRIPLIRTRMTGLAMGTSYGVYTGICHPVLSWKASKSNMGKLLTGLAKFPKLKTLLFVVHQEFQFEFDYRTPPPASLLPSMSSAQLLAQAQAQGQTLARRPHAPPIYINHSELLANINGHHYMPPSPAYTSSGASSAYSTPPPQSATEPRQQVVHQAYRFKFDVEDSINSKPRRPQLNDLLFYPIEDAKAADDRDDWETLLNNRSPSSTALPGVSSSRGDGDNMDADMEDTETSEWNDPWPTNDDWRRFRRRFQRAVVTTLQSGIVNGGDGKNALCIDEEASGAVMSAPSAKNGAVSAGGKKYQHSLQQQQQKCEASGMPGSGAFHPGHAGASLHNAHRSHATSHGGISKHSTGHRQRYSLKQDIPAIKGVSLLWRYTRGQ